MNIDMIHHRWMSDVIQSIATVTTTATVTRLTTLTRIKAELNITNNSSDVLLGAKIDEATSDIEAHLARTLCRETLTETFWGGGGAERLILARAPVASIASVTVDDDLIDAAEYRLDAGTGLLYRIDASGFPSSWWWCKSIIVVFDAGYLLPGETGRNLPAALEAGAISLINSFWQARGRDPLARSEEVPGVMRVDYWVGAVGQSGELPPDVVTRIAPFRRVLA